MTISYGFDESSRQKYLLKRSIVEQGEIQILKQKISFLNKIKIHIMGIVRKGGDRQKIFSVMKKITKL
ncbi:TPA: hypothetical protein DEP34_01760 [Candidatus Uhrbacteria bacterium]|uniref:Uncharacterized protein n=2 Tax=Candidatus Uhriibacteriota TaxID=1752732 RepID=A0A0G1SF36_9BACT|nr:MAG: hypothetical protein UX45_C0011G0017 [Candidatus Uhrbacteria bacterium GW2011_GWF2_46_218]KKU40668.1 MAG: hypothetical protein UX57_C0012G0017 [Candidatus Uhrbacteria bacterium GW2011_GWE2_46_68]HBK34345.1 hypothetical protein [Candidatus Uhrbacteria bacterium]HCB19095.1 hypothetical protein [Candidatus Uhrbacteria bacterium]